MIRILAQEVEEQPIPADQKISPKKNGRPLADEARGIPFADDEDNQSPAPQSPTAPAAPAPSSPVQLQPESMPAPGGAPQAEQFPEGISPEEYEEIPQPEAPQPEPTPAEQPEPSPEQEFEEITEEESELDKLNKTLSIEGKIDTALSEGYPLRIQYTTKKGFKSERTIHPDYYMFARTTGNWVLIAWDELRGGWRGFIVNRIGPAKLEPKNG